MTHLSNNRDTDATNAAAATATTVTSNHLSTDNDPTTTNNPHHPFHVLMNAFVMSTRTSDEQAQALLDQWRSETNKSTALSNAFDTFAIHAYVNIRPHDPIQVTTAARADAILQLLQQIETQDMVPNNRQTLTVHVYNTVMEYLVQAKTKDAADRVQAIFNEMMDKCSSSNTTTTSTSTSQLSPNTMTFNNAIAAVITTRNNAGIKADAIFSKMKSLGVAPNTQTFASLITAWAYSSDDERNKDQVSIIKAENYFEEMKRMYHEHGDERCKPNENAFNAIIHAWSMSKENYNNNNTAFLKAESYMKEMKRLEKSGDNNCSPTLTTYNSFLKVIARSTIITKAELADAVLMEMDQRSIQPNDISFGTVLMACAYSNWYDLGTRERALHIAVKVMYRAQAESIPSRQTFGFFFVAAFGFDDCEQVAEVYKWCCEAGYENEGPIEHFRRESKYDLTKRGSMSSTPRLNHYNILLESAPGSWDAKDWQIAMRMPCWSQEGSGSIMAWTLMDRAVKEDEIKSNDWFRESFQKVFLKLFYRWHRFPDNVSARDILGRIEKYRSTIPEFNVPIQVYNFILYIAIKTKERDAHKLADECIQSLMVGGSGTPRPNSVTFNAALQALSISDLSDAAQRAEALLQTMKSLMEDGWEDMQPSRRTYHALISTLAKSTVPWAPERAEQLLNECPDLTVLIVNTAMGAWKNSFGLQGPDRCNQLFRHLQKLYAESDNKDIKPNTISYGMVIAAFAKFGRAIEAESILQELLDEFKRTKDPDLAPNAFVYNAVIDAWSKSNKNDAVQKSEALIDDMYKIAKETKNNDLLPNRIHYTSFLNTLAKSNDPDLSSRVEHILRRLHELDKKGIPGTKPDFKLYSCIIDCLAKSNSKEGAARAEDILNIMIARYKAGEVSVKPSSTTFNIVIKGHGKSGDVDAGPKAEAVFLKMKSFGAQPTKKTFGSLTHAALNSDDPKAAEKAEWYFKERTRLYEAGNESCKPEARAFDLVITACSRYKNQHGVARARFYLDEMERLAKAGNTECLPTVDTYNSFLGVISKSFFRDKASMAYDALLEMEQRGLRPICFSFELVLMACAFSEQYDLPDREKAFSIAVKVMDRVVVEVEPLKDFFILFFEAAAGLGHEEKVAAVYKMCCEAGHENDELIQLNLQKAAPHFSQSVNVLGE